MLITILVGLLLVGLYLLRRHYQYWEKRGVAGPKPTLIFGNIGECLRFKKSLPFFYNDVYSQYPDEPYVGVFKVFSPTLIMRDRDLVKDTLIRNFQYFAHNDFLLDLNKDPLLGRNPFMLRNEMWKRSRSEAIRCFTGSKMKAWFPLVDTVARELVTYIESNIQPLEAKATCLKFTVSAVASCAFGIDAKCFENDSKSEFEYLAQNFISSTSIASMMLFVNQIFPLLRQYVKFSATQKEINERLIEIVKENVKSRLDHNIVRNDFLQAILEVKKNDRNDKDFEIEITAHAAGFLIDGYETSSVAMSFFLYNIASNKDVQEKIRKEVNDKIREHGEFNYESLQEMEYLEAALSESMRKHPALPSLVKECSKDFAFKDFVMRKGTSVVIPALNLQNDPKYWDEPEKYKPERFLKGNKMDTKGIYFAFGDGPRMCLGTRFGNLQLKIAVAHIIRNFELSVNSRTHEPIRFDPVYFLLSAVGGLWLNFKKIPFEN